MTFAAVPWHWWIALPITIGAILLVIVTIVGYLTKVVYPRYPKRR